MIIREWLKLEGEVFGDFVVIAFNGVKNKKSGRGVLDG